MGYCTSSRVCTPDIMIDDEAKKEVEYRICMSETSPRSWIGNIVLLYFW